MFAFEVPCGFAFVFAFVFGSGFGYGSGFGAGLDHVRLKCQDFHFILLLFELGGKCF